MKKFNLNLTTQYVIIVCALLLVVNVALGMILMTQSGKSLSTLIRRHMIAVSDTAAASIDGDMLGSITENDVDSPEYALIANTLTKIMAAQKDNDIKYIYCAKKSGDHFVFTVDPDPVNPAGYGEEVVYTPAQDTAWSGISSIDENTYEDKWGEFYTAWSPIRNSEGIVISIVGVDFVRDWYDKETSSHRISVIICSTVSLLVGAAIMVMLTAQLRRRFRKLNGELRVLTNDLDKLSGEITNNRCDDMNDENESDCEINTNSIGALSGKVHRMQRKLTDYMEYAHKQAYTDSLTGVSNNTAYLEYVEELNKKINEGTAAFAVAVFDLNGLKETNDNYGHECGDRLLKDAAQAISKAFGEGRTFRIGGDEFISVIEHTDQKAAEENLAKLDEIVARFNSTEKQYAMDLSISSGCSAYIPGKDSAYKVVFKRADKNMYRNKGDFYRRFGDRKDHYEEDQQQ